MTNLRDVLETAGKPIRQGEEVVIYFPPTGVHGGSPIFPVLQGKLVRADDDGIVIDRGGILTAFAWEHIAGLQPTK